MQPQANQFPRDPINDDAPRPREGATAYTIRTPQQRNNEGFEVEFAGVRNGIEFRHNRAVVYDVKVARALVSDYGYDCSPALPALGPNSGPVDRIMEPSLINPGQNVT